MMSLVDQSLTLAPIELRCWRRYLLNTMISLVGAVAATFVIYVFDFSSRFIEILLVYVLVVLGVALIRGFYTALLTSLIAFFSFGFFVIPFASDIPSPTIDKWTVFLFVLVITGLLGTLASVSQKHQRAKREGLEMRVLYQLMKDIDDEEDLEIQLQIIAAAIVRVFALWGVRECSFLERDTSERLLLRAKAPQSTCSSQFALDEESAILQTMKHGQSIVLHDVSPISPNSNNVVIRFIVADTMKKRRVAGRFVYIAPLKRGQQVIGGLRLVIEGNPELFGESNPQTAFFRTFLDQAMSVIERSHLRQEKSQAEAWQRADELRASLIRSVSHDFRIPLSTIKIAASTLHQIGTGQGDEVLQQHASTLQQEADRLNRLVTNLLDMSRIEGKALRLKKVLYPLDALIYQVLGRMQQLLQHRPMQIDLPDDLPPVELESTRIDQVLTNLLENVVRYTPAKSPIEIKVQVDGGYVLVSVADRGPGIAPGDLELIFDKFYRVEKQQYNKILPEGSGLGLAICKGIIEAHGGQIWATNRQDGGSIFSFTLPLP